jgi:uncharacterized coiled-coil protein SlyX
LNSTTPADVERLELKIAFLEQANQQLSDVAYRQQQEIDALRRALAELIGRVDSLKDQEQPLSPAEERPPHY